MWDLATIIAMNEKVHQKYQEKQKAKKKKKPEGKKVKV